MPNLKQRSTLPEKMDDLTLPDGDVRRALDDIETINKLLGGYRVVLKALDQMKWPREVVTIMDVGSGGGDMLRAIARWSKKRYWRLRLIGVDINPAMTRYASNKSIQYPEIRYKTASVFDEALVAETPHIVICSLFAHHFDDDNLVSLVARIASLARHAVIINDIHRHPVAYHAIRILTRVFGKSSMVQYDAPLSVARSLTRDEWQSALEKAGIKKYTIQWRWAWRWEIIIYK